MITNLSPWIVGFFAMNGMLVFARIFVIDGIFVLAQTYQVIARELVLLMAFNDACSDILETASSWDAWDFHWSRSRNRGLEGHDAAGCFSSGTG